MGLDWCLLDKPAMGRAEEFYQLKAALTKASDEDNVAEYEKIREKLCAVSISPADSIGAPRIGADEDATKWFQQKWEKIHAEVTGPERDAIPNKRYVDFWSQSFEECLKENTGAPVYELVGYDKSPVLGMIAAPTGFRGKVIGYSEILSEELKSEAYEDHTAEEAVDYGRRMLENLTTHFQGAFTEFSTWSTADLQAKVKQLHTELQKAIEAYDSPVEPFSLHPAEKEFTDSLPRHLRSLFEAFYDFAGAEWCIFWGEHGHGFHAWF